MISLVDPSQKEYPVSRKRAAKPENPEFCSPKEHETFLF
jgi:hypothetical protein